MTTSEYHYIATIAEPSFAPRWQGGQPHARQGGSISGPHCYLAPLEIDLVRLAESQKTEWQKDAENEAYLASKGL